MLIVGFDNERGKGDHCHMAGKELPCKFTSVDQLLEDVIATQGSLKIYPNEDHALILVEVIGDNTPEPDETFYLDVFNPVVGGFGPGVVQLTAVRTILNDDGIFGM